MATTSRSADLTSGPMLQKIILFSVPLAASSILQLLFNAADVVVVGRFAGSTALAAVGSNGALINLLVNLFVGLSLGANVVAARCFGARDEKGVQDTVHTAVALGLVSGVLLAVVGFCAARGLLELMSCPEDVIGLSTLYLRIYFIGMPMTMLYNFSSALLRAVGDTKRPLYFLIVSSLTNVVLDLLFVAVLRWGVWSAALATIISQALSAVLCAMHLAKKGTIYQLKLSALRIDGPLLREILRYGLPAGIQNSVIGLANVVVQTNINSFGKMATAAYGAYSKIEGFAFLPVTSFTMAITTYVGQNLGAGMKPRARKGAIFGIAAAAVIAEIIGVITYLAAPWLVSLFSRTPEVIRLGVLETRTICLFYCLLAFSHAIASVCRGAGKAFVPMTIMQIGRAHV